MNKNVFINCPFDNSYNTLKYTLIFTIISLGYIPRLALECTDASRSRLEIIKELINNSRVSIHDLSKIKSK